jgi:hypothetical protein
LYAALGQSLPDDLARTTTPGSFATAGAFAGALASFL